MERVIICTRDYRGYSKLKARTALRSYGRAMPRSIGPPWERCVSLFRSKPCNPSTGVGRRWHEYDSPGQILALALSGKGAETLSSCCLLARKRSGRLPPHILDCSRMSSWNVLDRRVRPARREKTHDLRSRFKNDYFAEMSGGSEEGSCVRLKDVCITQL